MKKGIPGGREVEWGKISQKKRNYGGKSPSGESCLFRNLRLKRRTLGGNGMKRRKNFQSG